MGALFGTLAFGKILGSKSGRDDLIAEARSRERARLARQAWQQHRAAASVRNLDRRREPVVPA